MAYEWIKELKPGDEVLVSSPYQNKRIVTVEKITPTGLIKVENMYFNRDGSQRGGDVFGGCRISECTPEKKKELMQERVVVNTVKILRTFTKDSINYEQAVAIKKILEQNAEYGIWVLEGSRIPYCSECGEYSDDADTRDAKYCSHCGMLMSKEYSISITPINKETGRMFGEWKYHYSADNKAKPWICNKCGHRRENPTHYCPKCNTDMHLPIKD